MRRDARSQPNTFNARITRSQRPTLLSRLRIARRQRRLRQRIRTALSLTPEFITIYGEVCPGRSQGHWWQGAHGSALMKWTRPCAERKLGPLNLSQFVEDQNGLSVGQTHPFWLCSQQRVMYLATAGEYLRLPFRRCSPGSTLKKKKGQPSDECGAHHHSIGGLANAKTPGLGPTVPQPGLFPLSADESRQY
jgi:hypothetical protein